VTYSYDKNGNPTQIGNRTFQYNHNNRLVKVKEGESTIAEYTYNGLNQRAIKKAGDKQTVFLYDFDGQIIAEGKPDGTYTTEYIYLGNTRLAKVDIKGFDRLVYYYANNYLGTPFLMTDERGVVVWEAEYKPFGQAKLNPNSKVVNNFRFAGQYYDDETGLHYNFHRYYDPKTGRYLTPDPIGLIGGINIYNYVFNNPINLIDPFGLWGFKFGASSVGIDFSMVIYDSNAGWFPNPRTEIGVSTTIVGAGLQFTFDTPVESQTCSDEDVIVSLGLSKYMGSSFNTELSRGSLNVGIGLGLPANLSSSIENFTVGLSQGIQRLIK
jgi:RHS repeat-associated protein